MPEKVGRGHYDPASQASFLWYSLLAAPCGISKCRDADSRCETHSEPKSSGRRRIRQSVVGIRDINGDGIGDLVIGAPGADKVYVLSGKDQSLMRTISDPDGLSKYQFGSSVVDVGDWDGDGFADFAVGAPGSPTSSRNRAC